MKLKNALFDRKKKKLVSAPEFQEDKVNVSLAEQLLYKKTEPYFIQMKKKLAPSKWSEEDTRQFFKILQLIGMDFTLMEQFFPKRNRKQLLRKFHKEKKKHPQEVQGALDRHLELRGKATDRYSWMANTPHDFKFSESNSSSFDSMEQVRDSSF